MDDYLYRISNIYCINSISLYTEKFRILRKTKCGVWIDNYGAEKFVNLQARKQFACISEEEARVSFIKRKEKQLRLLREQMDNIERALQLAKENKVKYDISDIIQLDFTKDI